MVWFNCKINLSFILKYCHFVKFLKCCNNILYLLYDFLFGHVQVTVAYPLNLKPVFEAAVPTALELYLQCVHSVFQEAASWHVCVLIEPHSLHQAQVQSLFQFPVHGITHQSPHKHAEGEKEGAHNVGQHDQLPSQELGGVHAVIADLPTQEIDNTSNETHSYQHVGNILDVPLCHQLFTLFELHLEEETQAEQDDPCNH